MVTAFHYSDMAGAHGLLTSAEFWATDLRFLNDERELRHGVEIASQAFTNVRSTLEGDVLQFLHFVEDVLQLVTLGPKANRRFAVSLSRNGDLLSQWRAYGGGGTGCALGFDTEVLADMHGLECRDVCYDAAEARAEMEAALTALVEELASSGVPEDSARREELATDFAEKVTGIALGAKHPAFEDERELRLSVVGTTPLQRVRASEIVSYVPIQVSDATSKVIPSLVEIVLGPLASERAEIGLRELLLTLGYPENDRPVIDRSTIPYRA